MNYALNAARTFTATLLSIGTMVGVTQAALVASLTIDNATEVTISINGTIEGPEPESGAGEWLFILLNPGVATVFDANDFPADGPGDLNVNGTTLNRAFVRSDLGGPHIELNFGNALSPGASVSGSKVLTFNLPHGIDFIDLQNAELRYGWGASDIANGTFQGRVIPEPTTALLAVLGLGVVARRRRRR